MLPCQLATYQWTRGAGGVLCAQVLTVVCLVLRQGGGQWLAPALLLYYGTIVYNHLGNVSCPTPVTYHPP